MMDNDRKQTTPYFLNVDAVGVVYPPARDSDRRQATL